MNDFGAKVACEQNELKVEEEKNKAKKNQNSNNELWFLPRVGLEPTMNYFNGF